MATDARTYDSSTNPELIAEPRWYDDEETYDTEDARRELYRSVPALEEAFGRMRAAGLMTNEGMGCCSGCTAGTITPAGAYYHEQNLGDATGRSAYATGEYIMVGYDGLGGEKGPDAREVGLIAALCLERAGLTVTCEDVPSKKLRVELPHRPRYKRY